MKKEKKKNTNGVSFSTRALLQIERKQIKAQESNYYAFKQDLSYERDFKNKCFFDSQ